MNDKYICVYKYKNHNVYLMNKMYILNIIWYCCGNLLFYHNQKSKITIILLK